MKKIYFLILVCLTCFTFTSCWQENVTNSLEEVIDVSSLEEVVEEIEKVEEKENEMKQPSWASALKIKILKKWTWDKVVEYKDSVKVKERLVGVITGVGPELASAKINTDGSFEKETSYFVENHTYLNTGVSSNAPVFTKKNTGAFLSQTNTIIYANNKPFTFPKTSLS